MRRVLLATCAVLLACGPAGPPAVQATVELELGPQPLGVGPAKAVLRLKDPTGQPLAGATLRLEGTMTHPGMTPVFCDAPQTAPGVYEGTLELTMGGDWVVIVTGQLNDGRPLAPITVPVPGVRSERTK